MFKLLFLSTLLFAFSTFAQDNLKPEICYTTGECQTNHPPAYQAICMKVVNGKDSMGNITCSLRCPATWVGYTCEKFQGKIYGVCRQEYIPNYETDMNNCVGAIDPADAP
jgi:hypothetical protein